MKNRVRNLVAALLPVLICAGSYFASPGTNNSIPSPATAASIESEARRLKLEWTGSSTRAAIAAFVEAAIRWREDADDARSAACLRSAAELELLLGNHTQANELAAKALTLDRAADNPDHQAQDLSLLALIALKAGDVQKAEAHLQRASALITPDSTAAAQAAVHWVSAEIKYLRYDLPATLDLAKQSLALWRQDGNTERVLESLELIAFVQAGLDDPFAAIETVREIQTIAGETGNLRATAISRYQMGFMYFAISEPQNALEACRSAEEMFPTDMEFIQRARLMNGLANIYEMYGETRTALTYSQEAFDLFGKENYLPGQLVTLRSLINRSFRLNEKAAAFEYFGRLRELSTKIDDKFYLAVGMRYVADHYLRAGQHDLALAHYSEALRTLSKTKFGRGVSAVLRGIGDVYSKKDDPAKARKHYLEALEIDQRIKDEFGEADTLYALTALDASQGKLDEALANLSRSLTITDKFRSNVKSISLRRELGSSISERYQEYLRLQMQRNKNGTGIKADDIGISISERFRARSLIDGIQLAGVDIVRDTGDELVQREKIVDYQLNVRSDKLTDRLIANADKSELDRLEAEIDDLRRQLEEIRVKLKERNPLYAAIKDPESFDVADFQANVLDENTVLLEFAFGKEESYLWTVDKTGVKAHYLPPRDEIETRINALRSLLVARQLNEGETFDGYRRRIIEAQEEYKAVARALSTDLLGQVAPETLAGRRLVVVADGRLHYFPLGALPMPNSEADTPILVTNEVVYAPSASALKILRMGSRTARPQRDVLVFADPVFSRNDERLTGLDTTNRGFVSTVFSTFRSIESLQSMSRLPASQQEAMSISDVVGASQTTVRSGFAANRDGVLAGGIEDYKILHFATHGLISEERPELSGILLSLYDDGGRQNEGGFIRLQDVYGMKLNSDLVVLSACDTGIGKEIKGEGVMSLNNAFLQAGARSVVSSLWKVDDNATKELMTEFYRSMAEDGLSASAALRQAQIKMYNDPRYTSPFFWAAFTASGDSEVSIAFASNRWVYIVVTGGALAAVVLLIYGLRRRRKP